LDGFYAINGFGLGYAFRRQRLIGVYEIILNKMAITAK
jgi:hypothetical protein